MAIKWSKINFKLVKRLRGLAELSFNNGDYIGAFVLQVLFLEGTLVLIVKKLLDQKGVDKELSNKFSQEYPTFVSLADYFFLLTTDYDVFNKLKDLNKRRNTIIHNIFEFETFDVLQQESRKLYLESRDLEFYVLGQYLSKFLKNNPEVEKIESTN